MGKNNKEGKSSKQDKVARKIKTSIIESALVELIHQVALLNSEVSSLRETSDELRAVLSGQQSMITIIGRRELELRNEWNSLKEEISLGDIEFNHDEFIAALKKAYAPGTDSGDSADCKCGECTNTPLKTKGWFPPEEEETKETLKEGITCTPFDEDGKYKVIWNTPMYAFGTPVHVFTVDTPTCEFGD